jgi:hypothetical protein
MTIPPQAVTAAYAARYGEPIDTYTWDRVADKVLEAAAPLLIAEACAQNTDPRDGGMDFLKMAYAAGAAAERDRIIGYLHHGNNGEGDMIDRLDDILQGRA